MAAKVGVIRSAQGLPSALAEIGRIERDAASPRLRNMAIAALLVAAAAYGRRESRGAQFRADCPATDAAQAHRTFLTLEQARDLAEEATQRRPVRVPAR
jgi:L-aspartate oxidase